MARRGREGVVRNGNTASLEKRRPRGRECSHLPTARSGGSSGQESDVALVRKLRERRVLDDAVILIEE